MNATMIYPYYVVFCYCAYVDIFFSFRCEISYAAAAAQGNQIITFKGVEWAVTFSHESKTKGV